jgi:hypothetical protein
VQQVINRGQVLGLRSAGRADGSRMFSSAPVAVMVVVPPSGQSAFIPGADTLGRDALVLDATTVIARDPATVMTERDGMLSLLAGQSAPLSAAQRISSSAPVLLFATTAAAALVIPPVEQWRTGYVSGPLTTAVARARAAATTPSTVTLPGGALTLAKAQGNYSFAELSNSSAAIQGTWSSGVPFLAIAGDGWVLGQSFTIIAP